MLYPFIFRPIFQERIWGGRNLQKLYAKELPPRLRIGESWEISDREEAQSVIVNGEHAGKTLHWLMENHESELLGNARSANGRFPLLVKILDAEEKLSLQVHPPASKAQALGGEPKTEMWYITQAKPGAELYVGLRPGATKQSFESKIADGSVADCFHRIPVQAGDAMFLPSGRVHAIGAGLVIFEIQQNSDTTYRVFDWNRKDGAGKARQLHVRESLECIDFHDLEPKPIRGVQKLVNDPLFSVEAREISLGTSLEEPLSTACILAVIEGQVTVTNGPALNPGQFCLVPACVGRVRMTTPSRAKLLLSRPGPS